jgi:hypothetical protein
MGTIIGISIVAVLTPLLLLFIAWRGFSAIAYRGASRWRVFRVLLAVLLGGTEILALLLAVVGADLGTPDFWDIFLTASVFVGLLAGCAAAGIVVNAMWYDVCIRYLREHKDRVRWPYLDRCLRRYDEARRDHRK